MGETGERTPAKVRTRRIDVVSVVIAAAVVALLALAGDGRAPATDAAAPPPGGFSHGAAGSGRNGFGGSIAPSPTMRSWPGTGADGNGGPFAFIGAHYGSLWQVPAAANNSLGVGYCVMEDVAGEGVVSLQPDPRAWDAGEMARAAAVMSTFGGDRVVPYGIDARGAYDVASGEWQHPSLLGGGEYTRRRHVAVNFGVKMFVEDASPSGAVAGLKLARDTAVVGGSGGEFSALRNGYTVAQRFAEVAEIQHAVGGVRLQLAWATADGRPPTGPGTHHFEVHATDSTGKAVGFVPVVALSDIGIGAARTRSVEVTVDRSGDTTDEAARWNAAAALGWPTMDMAGSLAADRRFALGTNPRAADVTDAGGVARFEVTVTDPTWELAFHTQAPTADVSLYAGTGIQGQITWSGPPQSASTHVAVVPPPPPPPTTTAPPTTTLPPAPPTTTVPTVVQEVIVRKVLDAADVQGDRDMSGFEFEVTHAVENRIERLTTGPNGSTPPIELEAGTYTVTEVGRPAWATGLTDGGPVTFDVRANGGESHEVVYTNVVPDASVATAARDAADSDQTVDLGADGATIIDTVTYTALVPDTEYVVTGELMARSTGAASDPDASNAVADTGNDSDTDSDIDTDTGIGIGIDSEPGIEAGWTDEGVIVASSTIAPLDMIATGITASATFVPSEPDGSIDVSFEVPRGSPLVGRTVVVYQRLAVAASGRIVAVHADPLAPEQTIRFADVPTTTLPSTITTTTAPTTTVAPTVPSTALPTVPASTMPASTVPASTVPPTTVVAAKPPPVTTTTTTATMTTPTSTTTTGPAAAPPRQLPRTGGDGSSAMAVGGLAIILLGVGLVLATVRAPDRRWAGPTMSVRHQRNGKPETDLRSKRGDPPSRLHRIFRR